MYFVLIQLFNYLGKIRLLDKPLPEADAVFAKAGRYLVALGLSRVGANPIECPNGLIQ